MSSECEHALGSHENMAAEATVHTTSTKKELKVVMGLVREEKTVIRYYRESRKILDLDISMIRCIYASNYSNKMNVKYVMSRTYDNL